MKNLLLLLAPLAACQGVGKLDLSEWRPGGDTTNVTMSGANAFLLPAANLTPEEEQDFFSGNAFFNQGWVEAPASTAARDGLGPLFNARSCSACHLHDGRAAPPEDGQGPFIGLLLRLSVPGPAGPVPDPVYGGQLQDLSLPDLPAEATPRITWSDDPLPRPTYHLEDPAWGPFPDDLLVSPRVAPAMIGLGLLEAIDPTDLEALADPDDADGDGISGRLQQHGERIGRFGWKGDAPGIPEQVAGAFAGDLGLTTSLHPTDDCTAAQPECTDLPDGGTPEVSDDILDLVVLYSRTLAVPARRRADDPVVMRGRRRFHDVGCDGCHQPSWVTGEHPVAALSGQTIWPYTDLLLHDMGPALADDRPVAEASGREWKTPPLWGIGLYPDVSGHMRLMHDGRADGVDEAIRWHGGEAEAARDAYLALDDADRDALVAFVEDL